VPELIIVVLIPPLLMLLTLLLSHVERRVSASRHRPAPPSPGATPMAPASAQTGAQAGAQADDTRGAARRSGRCLSADKPERGRHRAPKRVATP